MPENRYEGLIASYNERILELHPANQTLRVIAAAETARWAPHGPVLEIGSGEGHQTHYLMRQLGGSFHMNGVELTVVDESEDMMDSLRRKLHDHPLKDVQQVVQDAGEFLEDKVEAYQAIVSAWTFHNFPRTERQKLLGQVARALKPGGVLVLMDKVYRDHEPDAEMQLHRQLARYKYLPKDVEEAIRDHETTDFTPKYRLTENQLAEDLRAVDLAYARIAEVERDQVVIGVK